MKNAINFTINGGIDLEKVFANSLLIDSDTEIASIEIGKYVFSVMCRGEVRVNYKDETFYGASDYPQEIIDYFMGDEKAIDEERDDFWVGDNNWYEMEILRELPKDEQNIAKYECLGDIYDTFDIEQDVEGKSKSVVLYEEMVAYIKSLINDFEELQELDLSNL